MSKIMMWFKKTFLVAIVAVLGLSALPVASAFAQGLNDTATPPAPGQASHPKLEQAWAKEQKVYDRLGTMFSKSDTMITKVQNLIDKAKANGKDVSALQSALDAFSAAEKNAKSIYDSAQSEISSHPGFDSDGKVTDATQASATVKDLGSKLKDIRQAFNGTGKALRQAIREFRQANHPTQTPAPNQNGG